MMYPHTAHQEDQPILDVRDLDVRFGGRLALEHITFHLHAGENVAVVGPNGAGKSTLFKVVAGVLPAVTGEVNVFGSRPPAHVCIAYIPQRSQVDWNFPVTVADVVMMGRSAKLGPLVWPKRSDWQQVSQALETVGLSDLGARRILELSGGQQQRMFIARALAQEAELMLMDEPFTGLDAPSQDGILSLLNGLKDRRVTVMVATHDLQQAAQHFDRVMLLNRRLIGFGTAAEVLHSQNLNRAYSGRLRIVGGESILTEGGHEEAPPDA
jgi:ABC-type Mn2+/Zn2+ transport system ATPase subunit